MFDDREEVTAAASVVIGKFEDTQTRLDGYCNWYHRAHPGEANDLALEAQHRLLQVLWLLRRIRGLGEEFGDLQTFRLPHLPTDPSEQDKEAALAAWRTQFASADAGFDFRRFSEITTEVEILTESFYRIAWRTRSAVQSLPHLKGFNPKGVRDVRNKLMEHPEHSDSQIFGVSFGWGKPHGPVLKAIRAHHEIGRWKDRGLFVNAGEFAQQLSERLSRAPSATA